MADRPRLEIWSPLPPSHSGIADYVHEQLEFLSKDLDPSVVVEHPERVDEGVRRRYRVLGAANADPRALRLYHVGNSPAHWYAYEEAIRAPGIVFLHEWNLHELILGAGVVARRFDRYRHQMRREHGESGSIAAETISTALGGDHWTGRFPLNAELLERAIGVACLSSSTARNVAARIPGTPVLRLDHHAVLKARATDRASARARFGFAPSDRIVLAPGLGAGTRALKAVLDAVSRAGMTYPSILLVTVGGAATPTGPAARDLGRLDMDALGDALLAADVVVALRFPSRGEVSGMLMRALAAGRAAVVSSGSTADEDLPRGVVARVNPGVDEVSELAAVLDLLLGDDAARQRMERLAAAEAARRNAGVLTATLSRFIHEVAARREDLEQVLAASAAHAARVKRLFRVEAEAAASNLGLARVPTNVFERLEGLQ